MFLSYEAHRKALMKVLNVAHVIHDIIVDQFYIVVANITASQYLGFNEAELLGEGTAHNKSLHIFVTCMNTLMYRVLVDTGSPFNVMPKNTLSQFLVEGSEMRADALVVGAFDGSWRKVISEVDLPIRIGPCLFTITFQVMNINPTYICLLVRPWIHVTGTMTFTLHQ